MSSFLLPKTDHLRTLVRLFELVLSAAEPNFFAQLMTQSGAFEASWSACATITAERHVKLLSWHDGHSLPQHVGYAGLGLSHTLLPLVYDEEGFFLRVVALDIPVVGG